MTRTETRTGLLARIAGVPWLTVLLAGVLAFSGSAGVGLLTGIPEPQINDEFSYLLAADTFASGRLTNPPHPLWVHFESMHVIQQPTYASKFPPAQGLILAAGQAVGGEAIVGVWLSVGLMVSAICWMLYAWVPPPWAAFGGLLAALHFGIAGDWAQGYWGGAVAATGGALVFGALRRIASAPGRPCVRHAVILGAGLTVLANSRPFEGLVVSLPAGVVLLAWIVSRHGPLAAEAWKRVVFPLSVVLTVTAAAMSYYNYRVTGDALRLPYQAHAAAYRVEPVFLPLAPLPEPVYRHREIENFHTRFELDFYRKQHPIGGYGFRAIKLDQVTKLWQHYLGYGLSLPLLMLPWILRDRWFGFALATCAALILALAVETWVLHHYAAPITALLVAIVTGCLREWHRRDPPVGRFVTWLVVALAFVGLTATIVSQVRDTDPPRWHERRAAMLQQLTGDGERHLVVVRYGSQHLPQHEWVYNGADIDRAPVVWAREMDEAQSRRLLEYFRDRRAWLLTVESDVTPPVLRPYAVEPAR